MLGFRKARHAKQDRGLTSGLVNFRWTRDKINQLHDLAAARGTTATAILKQLVNEELKREEMASPRSSDVWIEAR